jgi:hypothetical protein
VLRLVHQLGHISCWSFLYAPRLRWSSSWTSPCLLTEENNMMPVCTSVGPRFCSVMHARCRGFHRTQRSQGSLGNKSNAFSIERTEGTFFWERSIKLYYKTFGVRSPLTASTAHAGTSFHHSIAEFTSQLAPYCSTTLVDRLVNRRNWSLHGVVRKLWICSSML